MLLLLCVVIALATTLWLASRRAGARERRGFNSPRALFGELCRGHGLKWENRRLLWRLARAQQLTHPTQLFLEPDRFDLANLGPDLAAQHEQFALLRDAIFGTRIEHVAEDPAQ